MLGVVALASKFYLPAQITPLSIHIKYHVYRLRGFVYIYQFRGVTKMINCQLLVDCPLLLFVENLFQLYIETLNLMLRFHISTDHHQEKNN